MSSTTASALARKIPDVTLAFWIMKICATTLGETAGDLMSMTLDVGYALSSVILLGFFALTLAVQLATRRYVPAVFWLVVLSTSTAGTTISDFMDRTLALGYVAGSAILAAILVVVLVIWRFAVGTVSIDRVSERKPELFYWAAILVSNTLGTATGDFLADSSGLGFAGGALVIGGLLAVVVVLALATRLSRVALFWIAFVLTRPLGATAGDLLTKDHDKGGLGLGTLGSSAVLFAILAILVVLAHARPALFAARRQER